MTVRPLRPLLQLGVGIRLVPVPGAIAEPCAEQARQPSGPSHRWVDCCFFAVPPSLFRRAASRAWEGVSEGLGGVPTILARAPAASEQAIGHPASRAASKQGRAGPPASRAKKGRQRAGPSRAASEQGQAGPPASRAASVQGRAGPPASRAASEQGCQAASE